MKILIIGSGGREHAFAWKTAQSAAVTDVFVAPGNAGTANTAKVSNVAIDPLNNAQLLEFAQNNAIDLTIVGPEGPLVNGVVDLFQAHGLKIFGPRMRAAQLEGSKAFCKDFLKRHGIPTAAYETFTDSQSAIAYLNQCHFPVVIKADGLAAGKGVIIAEQLHTAQSAIHDILDAGQFGSAGQQIVIEEFLHGEEVSFICLAHDGRYIPLASAQDHKAALDGDLGPNTGGMGAYSPAPIVDAPLHQRIVDQVIQPTLDGLNADGIAFTGFLYAGLMVNTDGIPRVLEFNVRCGDPETQPLLSRLQSDLVALINALLDGHPIEAQWDPRTAVGVVMAAGGYPGDYASADIIDGLDAQIADTQVFHAGTRARADGTVETNGGRVLCVVGLDSDVSQAQKKAYQRVAQINWSNVYYRRDIAHRAINR